MFSPLQSLGFDENKLQQIYDELLKGKPDFQKEKKKKTLPKGTYNRNTLLFPLNKELSRARRYKIPFSAITFSIVNVTPKKPVPLDLSSEMIIERIQVLFGGVSVKN